jgi:hypothetical protein
MQDTRAKSIQATYCGDCTACCRIFAIAEINKPQLVAGRSLEKDVQWAIARFRKRFPDFRVVYIAPGTIVETAKVTVVGPNFYLKNEP